MSKEKRLFTFIFISHWILLWVSINTLPHPHGLSYMLNRINFFNNFYESFYNIRILLPLLSTILITLLFIYLSFKKKFIFNKFHIIFFIIFFTHLIGLIANTERNLGLNNIYLPILGISTVILFYSCEIINLNLIKYLFWISLFFLFLILIIIIFPKISEIKNLDFSTLFSERELNIIKTVNPRITGLSRSLAIINLFMILIIFNMRNIYTKNFLLLCITINSVIIIFMQSRGTLLCFYTSLVFLILYLSKDKINDKIKKIIVLIFVPFFLYFSINTQINHNISINEPKNINNRIFEKHSSGRVDIWTFTLKNNDYKKIFGYGAQGDRFFLKNYNNKNIYGDNSSNIFIYSLLSGGFICLIFLMLFFYEILKSIIKNKRALFSKKNQYVNFSIICLIFFIIRSAFENSFGLFSIDFLIMYLSVTCIINSNKFFKYEKY